MTNLYTLKIATLGGVLWEFFNLALGGIDTPIRALAFLMIADFITGVKAGYNTDSLSSKIGAKGLLKKSRVIACIILAVALDAATSLNMFRGMVISGFAIIEAISLVENVDRMGYGDIIPTFLRDKLGQIATDRGLKEVEKHD